MARTAGISAMLNSPALAFSRPQPTIKNQPTSVPGKTTSLAHSRTYSSSSSFNKRRNKQTIYESRSGAGACAMFSAAVVLFEAASAMPTHGTVVLD